MLDIKRIRKNPEELVAAMKARRNKGAGCQRHSRIGRKTPRSNPKDGTAQGET